MWPMSFAAFCHHQPRAPSSRDSVLLHSGTRVINIYGATLDDDGNSLQVLEFLCEVTHFSHAWAPHVQLPAGKRSLRKTWQRLAGGPVHLVPLDPLDSVLLLLGAPLRNWASVLCLLTGPWDLRSCRGSLLLRCCM